jgi:hypothetical protein
VTRLPGKAVEKTPIRFAVEDRSSVVSDTESTLTDTTDETSTENGGSNSAAAAAAAAKQQARIISKKITEDGSNSELKTTRRREPVHRAITITMEAYAMVLVTTPKTNKCELAMDGMPLCPSSISRVELEVKTTLLVWFKGCGSGQGWYGTASGVLDASIGGEYRENVRVQRGYRSDGSRSDAASHHDVAAVSMSTMLLALRSTFHVYL